MSRTPTIFGISMASKTKRRWLVLVCYVVLCASILLAFSSKSMATRFALTVIMNMVFGSIQFVIFYKLAKDTVLPLQQDFGTVSLGLSRNLFSNTKKLDEREVAIRNAAYYRAYRIIVIALLLLMPIALKFLMTPINEGILALYMCSFLVVALTLPQAIILWTEPDLPEETL